MIKKKEIQINRKEIEVNQIKADSRPLLETIKNRK